VSRAEEISRISGQAVSWRSLDEIARHAYWQRLDPAGGWQVMMTTNEACLHNPYANPRTFTVCRPHGPNGSRLHTEEATLAAAEGIRVTVPAESVATIQLLVGKDTLRLPPRPGCSLYPAELFAETPVTR
jgi:hypothetical protein